MNAPKRTHPLRSFPLLSSLPPGKAGATSAALPPVAPRPSVRRSQSGGSSTSEPKKDAASPASSSNQQTTAVTLGDASSVIDRIGERMPLYADNLGKRHHPSPGSPEVARDGARCPQFGNKHGVAKWLKHHLKLHLWREYTRARR